MRTCTCRHTNRHATSRHSHVDRCTFMHTSTNNKQTYPGAHAPSLRTNESLLLVALKGPEDEASAQVNLHAKVCLHRGTCYSDCIATQSQRCSLRVAQPLILSETNSSPMAVETLIPCDQYVVHKERLLCVYRALSSSS